MPLHFLADRIMRAARLSKAQIDQFRHLPQPALREELEQLTGAQIDQLLHLPDPSLRDAVRQMQLMAALATHLDLRNYWLLEQNLLSVAEVLQLAKDASIELPEEVVASYRQHKFPEPEDDEG